MALKVSVASPQLKLKVTTNNGGFQTQNYNPQVTAPVKYVQNATPQKPLQSSPQTLQGGNSNQVQPVATAEQIARIAEQARIALAQEVARQKAIKGEQTQNTINQRTSANQSAIKLAVTNAQNTGKISVGRNFAPPNITVPKFADGDQELNTIREQARSYAMRNVDATRADPTTGFLSKAVDKLTFGSDRRAMNARDYSTRQANSFADRNTKLYESKIDQHLSLQARLQSEYEKLKLSKSSLELSQIADQYNKLVESSLRDLLKFDAYFTGTMEGYGLKAEEKLTSRVAKLAGSFNKNIIQRAGENPVWKYTLGSGSENLPSIVTAPSRAINFIGNLNTPDRQIYKTGGAVENRLETKKNAWQSTYNQRNINLKPWTDVKPGKQADAILGDQVKSLINARKQMGEKDQNKLDYSKVMETMLVSYNRTNRNQNSLLEFGADPLNLVAGTSKIGAKGASKYLPAISKSKYFKPIESIKNSSVFTKLTSEAKTPEQHLFDAIEISKSKRADVQDKIFQQIRSIDSQLSDKPLDFKLIEDFSKLTDSEAKILQRMVGGKLSARDRLLLAGKNNMPIRTNLEDLAKRWDTFAEKMKLVDEVVNTRFGRGKRLYSPRTAWTNGDLSKYNFFRKSKGSIQSKDDFVQGVVDRYISSDLPKNFKIKSSDLSNKRQELFNQYDQFMTGERDHLTKLKNRAKSTRLPRKILNAPTSIWKKSVLKYRPAWTVNNTLYNLQAGVLSGGLGYLPEQAKMLLRPNYRRKVYDNAPSAVRSDLGKEIGTKGKLNKFYTSVENNPRASAYSALKKKGYSDEEAIKRVNKYFFDYSTKNWERPLKTVMPFWAWQKSLTKAAVQMPFDRPLAAEGYNRLDKQQQSAYDRDFETMRAELQKLGYTDDEINAFKEENRKYYKGKLKIGNKYYNTPFNPFSEKGLTDVGFNPYLATAGEVANSTDSRGLTIKGSDSDFIHRLKTKFPQAEIGYNRYKGYRVDKSLDKPSEKYIGEKGHDGYGLTKEKQGYDKSKPNYVSSLDPRRKTKNDITSFVGVPRSTSLDKQQFVETKKLAKLTSDYFKLDTKDLEFDEAEKKRQAVFDKYGIKPDDFYKGVLSKYDSDHTKKVKTLKEDASTANKKLFEEYAKQPQGTRNIWATKKLQELNQTGYFDTNPFLKGFKWISSESVSKAEKQQLVTEALRTGDWSSYRKKYGSTAKQIDYEKAKLTGDWSDYTKKYGVKSAKAKAYRLAKETGNWTSYRNEFGVKETPYQYAGKYFKSAESMEKYKTGEFWLKYAEATPEDRKKLLIENDQYNTRKNWSAKQWTAWRAEQRNINRQKIESSSSSKYLAYYLNKNKLKASSYVTAKDAKRRSRKVVYSS